MLCSNCGENAIVSKRSSKIHLCERHFLEDFEDTVRETIAKEKMLQCNDRIAVALSGGKDSSALLYILKKILSDRNDIEMFAITIDEGIAGYREETIRSALKMTERLGIEHIIVSFKNDLGLDLDEIIIGKKEAPCSFCGVFRKSLLNRTAKKFGATKVATGHDLDDEAQSVMMNYMKGDIERLGRFMPRRIQPRLVQRIKPLKNISERDTALYCMVNGFYLKMAECPYANLSLRSDVRDLLNDLENKFPGIKQSCLRGFYGLSDLLAERYPPMELSFCSRCGEPCVDNMCRACQLLKRLQSDRSQNEIRASNDQYMK